MTPIALPPIEGPGVFGKFEEAIKAGSNFGFILGSLFKVVLVSAGLWTFIQFIQAGFAWISSGGDQKALEGARNRLTYALLGLIIVAASIGLIMLSEQMLGVCFGFSCDVNLDALTPKP